MTDEVAALSQPAGDHNLAAGEAFAEIATGGTLFANALSMAAGRAALTEVLTPQAFDRASALGTRMVDGMRAAIATSACPGTSRRWAPTATTGSGRYRLATAPSPEPTTIPICER